MIWVQEIFYEAKGLIDYFYRSVIVLQLMRQFTDRDLKYPCKIRFASNFLMLQSIVEVEEKLRLLVASAEWRGLRNSRSFEASRVLNTIQRESFWIESKEILMFMEPIVRVFRFVDGDGLTSGYLYEAMERARRVLEQLKETDNRYEQILKIFDKRRDENSLSQIHYAAAILNIAYYCGPRFKKNLKFKEATEFIGDTLVPQAERGDFYEQLASYQMKSSLIFSSSAMIMMEKCRPPNHVVLQPVREIEVLEMLHKQKKRNRLSAEILVDLVYVRMKSLMMEKKATLEQKNMLPINLDNISVYYDDENVEDIDREIVG
ncbi:uncharacterized protein LOC122672563 [Telopea speciosissima]|uniref:uncharacterized protein LOC122672563 n=1 Tax=Telopea speciosissima TaxID=54955 RepID=UPI001CC7DC89|nr:uncharacterized protein LOC122672563 [Telopea speciosissima]